MVFLKTLFPNERLPKVDSRFNKAKPGAEQGHTGRLFDNSLGIVNKQHSALDFINADKTHSRKETLFC